MLLAKSNLPEKPPVTLVDHLQDTGTACLKVFRGRVLDNWCRAFRICAEEFRLNAVVACLLHDIGKANNHFQTMLTKPRGQAPHQALRHEHIGALILMDIRVRKWLEANPSLDLPIITSAVVGHHLKAPGNWMRSDMISSQVSSMKFYLDDTQVQQALCKVAETAGLSDPPSLNYSDWDDYWEYALGVFEDFSKQARREMSRNADRMRLHAAVKAAVIISDSVASAFVRESIPFEWLDTSLHQSDLTADALRSEIIGKRMASTGIKHLNSIQVEAKYFSDRSALVAGCGLGKTLAGLEWAASRLDHYRVGRVVYLYPTRGTASEGFKDYIGWIEGGRLVSGTASYEIEVMRENPPDSVQENGLPESHHRLFALQHWAGIAYSATVDQFLGFLQNRYASLCLLPILLDSVVILDEVHSYDPKMWESLKCWLKVFDVPTLCMSASIEEGRKKELAELGVSFYPRSTSSGYGDLHRRETFLRYRVDKTTLAETHQLVEARQSKKILWVVNTIAKAQALAQKYPHAICYHSRFRLKDRIARQREVLEAFRSDRSVLAITTQVCEMSLDIDADVLLTEVAPPESLVQRCGRTARNREVTSEVFWYEPEKERPYPKEAVARGRNLLERLTEKTVSIKDLAEAQASLTAEPENRNGWAPFCDDVFTAARHDFRDTQDYLKSCILDSDLEELQKRVRAKQPIDGLILDVPETVDDLPEPDHFPRYLSLISGDNYDLKYGYLNTNL